MPTNGGPPSTTAELTGEDGLAVVVAALGDPDMVPLPGQPGLEVAEGRNDAQPRRPQLRDRLFRDKEFAALYCLDSVPRCRLVS